MPRFLAPRPAPSDAAPLMRLLAVDELRRVDEERERLKAVMATVAPRRSTIVEGELKRLTRQRVTLLAAIARTGGGTRS